MIEPNNPNRDEPANKGLKIRPLDEVVPLVEEEMEDTIQALDIPTKAELENSDPRVPTIMCTPFLKPEEMEARTSEAQAILLVTFASGALPDRTNTHNTKKN